SGVGCQVSAQPPAYTAISLFKKRNFVVLNRLFFCFWEWLSSRDFKMIRFHFNRGWKAAPTNHLVLLAKL
ncbi:MAG: hypothetical protein PVF37_17075, partial [Desulfobacterales bacterium]